MKNKTPTLWILITTMNNWIVRVKQELLPQLKNVDEVIISHQITDKNIIPESKELWSHIKYYHLHNKGLSKNRNNAIKHSTADICYICDDDLNFIDGFEKKIKDAYTNLWSDLITFQVLNEEWEEHFKANPWKHSRYSLLKIWSIWITFSRATILKQDINFDEEFGLWTKYPVGEESIFLWDCYNVGLNIQHCDEAIVLHPNESSGSSYREELVIARIKVWKRMFWFFWWILAVFYFTIFDYKNYKSIYNPIAFFVLSTSWLFKEHYK